MSPERRIKRRELRAIFVESDYGIGQMIASGILDEPIRDTPGSHPYWTVSMVNAASRRLTERSNRPAPKTPAVVLSKRHKEKIRANA